MGSSVYIASVEGYTGKSTVALGVLEQLSRRVERVAVFRPIVRPDTAQYGGRDYVLDLLTSHDAVPLSYDESVGVTYDEVHRDPDAALDRIVQRYRDVADRGDPVLILGSDYTDVGTPTEFAYNARIAANLGAPVLLVLNGSGRTPEELRTLTELASAELAANHGSLFAVIANRVDEDQLAPTTAVLAGAGVPAYAIPEEPLLSAPSVADLMPAVAGQLLSGDRQLLSREVSGLVIAAMTMPNVLDRLFEGAAVVTAADRPEVVVGVLMAHASQNFPQVSAIFLNGGFALPDQVRRLIEGVGVTLPIIETDLGTHAASTALTAVRGRVTKDSPRKVDMALALFDRYVDGAALLDRLAVARSNAVTPLMFEHQVIDEALADLKHIVLPEGEEERILRAADALLRRRVARLTLLGDPIAISAKAAALGVDVSAARIVSPDGDEVLRERFAQEYRRLRQHRGVDLDRARDVVRDVSYFGTMMVKLGLADGMVSGAVHTTAHTIRPALEVVKTLPGVSVVSSVFFMCLENQVLVYGDCAVNPDPTAEQLADIAISSAATAAAFGIEPRVAMLSYSTGASGTGTEVEKVSKATGIIRERAPELLVEGPIQYDAAIDAAVAKTKLPGSPVAGRATVFIFPDLNTGNNTYKAVQRSANAVAVGPVLQGLRKPVNDLSRGATVRDIINTVAITAIQAQQESATAAASAERTNR
ncbi:phosphate acetyltransferase [Kribbella orskensis]|uniref:Phosphate acetyltransferase n=1 Tax=Kribbella orskensis TaxID=2512216 RepID=A0ABY2BNQ0_9ACTN|nr:MULTISPECIES: phosphate acetyltransferase [Kribbella]TCN42144.1 phosphate acetyltransferase [Kribbella sp. VKM Ac-2500]TCO26022.1 phosphate acetyltransferase [Kribbella orskensis]